MDDNAFFERAILASAARPGDDDAIRQLRELFSPEEFTAWEASLAGGAHVVVPVGHDDERDRYWAEFGEYGIQGTSPDSYEAAIRDLVQHVRAWERELKDAGSRLGGTGELSSLVGELDALSDDELRTYLLVRVSFDRGRLSFGIAEFVEPDGTAAQRAVPFDDGHPPAEMELLVKGRRVAYQSSTRGDRVAFSRVGGGPSIGDTLRQEEPTGDVDAEFPQADYRPASRESR